MTFIDFDPRYRFSLIHQQGNIRTVHGYYDKEIEASVKIKNILDTEDIENLEDVIELYKVDVNNLEEKHNTELENIDMHDVCSESQLIHKLVVDDNFLWKRFEVSKHDTK